MKVQHILPIIMVILYHNLLFAEVDLKKQFSSISILKDVIQKTTSKHQYDWRVDDYEIDLIYGYLDEQNNFENNISGIGFIFLNPNGFSYRIALARVNYWPTPSSNLVGRTPFKQRSGTNRYQLSFQGLLSIMEGRAITRLSPTISDIEFALFGFAGISYNHYLNRTTLAIKESIARFPGQDPMTPRFTLELGLKWNLYLPNSYGLTFEPSLGIPINSEGRLKYWMQFVVGSFVVL